MVSELPYAPQPDGCSRESSTDVGTANCHRTTCRYAGSLSRCARRSRAGVERANVMEQIKCASCGLVNLPGATICSNCGAELGLPTPPARVEVAAVPPVVMDRP